jgi:predicted amidohydrolase
MIILQRIMQVGQSGYSRIIFDPPSWVVGKGISTEIFLREVSRILPAQLGAELLYVIRSSNAKCGNIC